MANFWSAVSIATLAGIVSFGFCWLLTRAGGIMLDNPGRRSLHDKPIPKGGGVGIILGVIAAFLFFSGFSAQVKWIVTLGITLGLFSFLDDLYNLSPLIRLIVQGVLGATLITQGVWSQHLPFPNMSWPWPWMGVIFSWLLLVWMVNLYNFMDGMDGFAGCMAVIGFGGLSILGWQAGDLEYFIVCLVIVVSTAGFLLFNFPPARLFMGDVGSTALGFWAAGMILWGDKKGIFPLWVGLLIFSPFIVDATFTLFRRLFKGEKIWQAHRSHCYQRLVLWGWGHRRTLLKGCVLMLLVGLSALLGGSASVSSQWILFLGWFSFYVMLIFLIERKVNK